jgi:uncharacterized protein YciI
MEQWVYFIHAPREDFGATMSDEERAVWGEHFALLQRRLDDGTLILAGPTLGKINTGIHVFEAPDLETAERMMNEDPAIASGIGRGELRPVRATFIRGQAA